MSEVLTYFRNVRMRGGFVHRQNTGAPATACGIVVSDRYEFVAKDVDCQNCKATSTFRVGGHDHAGVPRAKFNIVHESGFEQTFPRVAR